MTDEYIRKHFSPWCKCGLGFLRPGGLHRHVETSNGDQQFGNLPHTFMPKGWRPGAIAAVLNPPIYPDAADIGSNNLRSALQGGEGDL